MSPDAEAAGEEFPDGTYGGSRLLRPCYVPGEPDPNAAAHAQELVEALDDWRVGARPELIARAAKSPQHSQPINKKECHHA